MPVVENAGRCTVALKLNAGNDPATGRMIVKTVSLSNIAPGADAEKVMAVADLTLATLKHPVVRVERTVVSTLESA